MCRFFLDIKEKVFLKQKVSKFLVLAYFKTILDTNVWIMLIYRLSNISVRLKLYPLGKIFWIFNRILFSVDIDPRADLAGGLVLIHGMGIGHEVKSKGKLKIYQGATIGGNSGKRKMIDGKDTGQPIIKENVILGPVIIGNNTIVGTNSVITKNVAQNSLVVGNNKVIREII